MHSSATQTQADNLNATEVSQANEHIFQLEQEISALQQRVEMHNREQAGLAAELHGVLTAAGVPDEERDRLAALELVVRIKVRGRVGVRFRVRVRVGGEDQGEAGIKAVLEAKIRFRVALELVVESR